MYIILYPDQRVLHYANHALGGSPSHCLRPHPGSRHHEPLFSNDNYWSERQLLRASPSGREKVLIHQTLWQDIAA